MILHRKIAKIRLKLCVIQKMWTIGEATWEPHAAFAFTSLIVVHSHASQHKYLRRLHPSTDTSLQRKERSWYRQASYRPLCQYPLAQAKKEHLHSAKLFWHTRLVQHVLTGQPVQTQCIHLFSASACVWLTDFCSNPKSDRNTKSFRIEKCTKCRRASLEKVSNWSHRLISLSSPGRTN